MAQQCEVRKETESEPSSKRQKLSDCPLKVSSADGSFQAQSHSDKQNLPTNIDLERDAKLLACFLPLSSHEAANACQEKQQSKHPMGASNGEKSMAVDGNIKAEIKNELMIPSDDEKQCDAIETSLMIDNACVAMPCFDLNSDPIKATWKLFIKAVKGPLSEEENAKLREVFEMKNIERMKMRKSVMEVDEWTWQETITTLTFPSRSAQKKFWYKFKNMPTIRILSEKQFESLKRQMFTGLLTGPTAKMTLVNLQLWLDIYKKQHNLKGCLKCYTLTSDSYLHIIIDEEAEKALFQTGQLIRIGSSGLVKFSPLNPLATYASY